MSKIIKEQPLGQPHLFWILTEAGESGLFLKMNKVDLEKFNQLFTPENINRSGLTENKKSVAQLVDEFLDKLDLWKVSRKQQLRQYVKITSNIQTNTRLSLALAIENTSERLFIRKEILGKKAVKFCYPIGIVEDDTGYSTDWESCMLFIPSEKEGLFIQELEKQILEPLIIKPLKDSLERCFLARGADEYTYRTINVYCTTDKEWHDKYLKSNKYEEEFIVSEELGTYKLIDLGSIIKNTAMLHLCYFLDEDQRFSNCYRMKITSEDDLESLFEDIGERLEEFFKTNGNIQKPKK